MDRTITSKNEQKLPKWAQTEFRLLRDRIKTLEKAVAAVTTPAYYSDEGVLFCMHSDLNGYRKLPVKAVRFNSKEVEFDVTHLHNGGLRVHATFRHLDKTLCVVPDCANVFQIHVAPDVKERENVDDGE